MVCPLDQKPGDQHQNVREHLPRHRELGHLGRMARPSASRYRYPV